MSSRTMPYEIIIDQSSGAPVRRARVYLDRKQIEYLGTVLRQTSVEMERMGLREQSEQSADWGANFDALGARFDAMGEMDCGS